MKILIQIELLIKSSQYFRLRLDMNYARIKMFLEIFIWIVIKLFTL